jgi:hypothetical protein
MAMSSLGLRVGISIADPGAEEFEQRGVSKAHMHHAFVELARQIFAAGGDLAYGGDLRREGYTTTLVELLRTYPSAERPTSERIHQFLARPVLERTRAEDIATLRTVASVTEVPSPACDTDVDRALAYLDMRKAMLAATGARIVLGGRLYGQGGRWPGVAEEAYLSVRGEQPLFVLGGLGGMASRLADAVRGEWPSELTSAFQLERTDGHRALSDAGVGPQEEELVGALEGAELRNGLTQEENLALMDTTDLDLMVALVLRGMWSLQGR